MRCLITRMISWFSVRDARTGNASKNVNFLVDLSPFSHANWLLFIFVDIEHGDVHSDLFFFLRMTIINGCSLFLLVSSITT